MDKLSPLLLGEKLHSSGDETRKALFNVISKCKLQCADETRLCCSAFSSHLYVTEQRLQVKPPSPEGLHAPSKIIESTQRLRRPRERNDWALLGRNTEPSFPSYPQPLFFSHIAKTLSALLLCDRGVWQCKSHLQECTFQWKSHFSWFLTLSPREWRCMCDPHPCSSMLS